VAVLDPAAGLAFDDFHFSAPAFDGLIAAHGSPAELRLATRCACWRVDAGQPDPACMACYPFGYLWDPPMTVTVFGPGRRGLKRYEEEGAIEVGDSWFTFPSGLTPTHYSRLVLPSSRRIVDDLLTKGVEDTTRWSYVLGVQAAHYTRRVPPTGQPYTVEVVPLVPGTDFTMAGRTVQWSNPSVPDGTRYTLRLETHDEWVLFNEQDRNEAGVVMPYRWQCKKLDFLVHPRGTGVASY
jgi:hypothetical protein